MRIRMRVEDTGPLRDALPLDAGLRRVLPALADDLAAEVRGRTRLGLDANGDPFEPLRSGDESTLEDSGAMVRAFQPVKVTDKGFVLGIRSRALRRRAVVHQDGIGPPRREWIGLSPDEIDESVERVVSAQIPPDHERQGK